MTSSVDQAMADVKISRREKAARTRTAIIEAAHAEFLERGFHGATVVSIAKRARVASQTVYFVFHTKAELISAVIDAAVMGDEELPPELTEWWRAMEAEPDPAASLRMFVRGAAGAFERASAISVVLAAAALTDDELMARHQQHERLRRTAFHEVVAGLAAKGPLAAGLDVDSATDVLLTVYGDATYHSFRTERGWSEERIVDWLADSLPRLLLAQ
jgi:AcrR family transcriptional regulator